MTSIRFRFHNGRVHNTILNREAQLQKHRQRFRENAFYTTVPYKGPNDKRACKPQCEEFLNRSHDLDRRMYKIIAAYDESQRDVKSKRTQYNLAESKSKARLLVFLLMIRILQENVADKLD